MMVELTGVRRIPPIVACFARPRAGHALPYCKLDGAPNRAHHVAQKMFPRTLLARASQASALWMTTSLGMSRRELLTIAASMGDFVPLSLREVLAQTAAAATRGRGAIGGLSDACLRALGEH